ncbi:MAG: hypothetical protein IPO72_18900 [Saprospiraceae bacterium]|nr:hypothetical protein [Candidatus Vicinibacter affinis]MBP6172199.1 hypothetical protein [Saprospiraceae bacterium]MBK6571638.1 hypothetical protein [Candidatus Vicinibacter affinis]MBK7305370.1 hypothetical protein [Candidatus Vicinibacter affinis]MBK7799594.1 hypothetical protein [Candidatus Vicinibacter affinis]
MNANYFNLTLLVSILIASSSISLFADQASAAPLNKDSISIEKLKTKIDSLSYKILELQKQITVSTKIECTKKYDDFKWQHWSIIFFMPVIMTIFAITLFIVLYRSKEFKVVKLFEIYRPPSNGIEEKKEIETQSTSRFIALLTGLTAIFVATTLVMYNGYLLVAQCNGGIDADGLWKILAGLGIGIIPYGINVWNKNTKEEAATRQPSNNSQNP